MTIEELNTIINQHQTFLKMIDELDQIQSDLAYTNNAIARHYYQTSVISRYELGNVTLLLTRQQQLLNQLDYLTGWMDDYAQATAPRFTGAIVTVRQSNIQQTHASIKAYPVPSKHKQDSKPNKLTRIIKAAWHGCKYLLTEYPFMIGFNVSSLFWVLLNLLCK